MNCWRCGSTGGDCDAGDLLCLPGSFSFKTAFDEDHARFSPGVLLQIENLKLLEKAGLDWCDSCAAQDHPMIDSLWVGAGPLVAGQSPSAVRRGAWRLGHCSRRKRGQKPIAQDQGQTG
ncbi:MAG: hypothetical protein IPL18_12200 [Sphingomonadales bacterium]|nr:hypothetical protein [Sphingomonadales bacterium]